MNRLIADLDHEFRRHKNLADRAIASLDDPTFFQRPAPAVNSIALIVKHLAGNLASRWTDFLETDGEKPDRNRDSEFVVAANDTRLTLLAGWERGWQALFATLGQLRESDLERTVTIRGEPHSVAQASLRGATHVAYHVGQILYVARLLQPEAPWLTVPPGGSRDVPGKYRANPHGEAP